MSGFIIFALGALAGFLLAVAIGVIITRWPVPERTAPVNYSAIGSGPVVDSSSFGKLPEDWQPIWNPRPPYGLA
jgi:hypothetical protein